MLSLKAFLEAHGWGESFYTTLLKVLNNTMKSGSGEAERGNGGKAMPLGGMVGHGTVGPNKYPPTKAHVAGAMEHLGEESDDAFVLWVVDRWGKKDFHAFEKVWKGWKGGGTAGGAGGGGLN